jgi:hypothetical protein
MYATSVIPLWKLFRLATETALSSFKQADFPVGGVSLPVSNWLARPRRSQLNGPQRFPQLQAQRVHGAHLRTSRTDSHVVSTSKIMSFMYERQKPPLTCEDS